MEKKVMNTRLAVAAVVLLFGLLLAVKEAVAVGYDDAPATEAAPATKAAGDGYAPATDAAEATPTTGKASYGKATKGDCEVPGTCDSKVAKAEQANPYTRGCSKINGCRG